MEGRKGGLGILALIVDWGWFVFSSHPPSLLHHPRLGSGDYFILFYFILLIFFPGGSGAACAMLPHISVAERLR